jgi:hypothetical protein
MEIHEGMGDLVAATFGRGFYVLDDYTPLRYATPELLSQEAALLPVRKAYAFEPIRYYSAGSGSGAFTAENPPFGAIFNYFLKEAVGAEETSVVLVVRDGEGELVSEVPGVNRAGFQRTVWNLRGQPPTTSEGGNRPARRRQGPMVEPGVFFVSLEARGAGGIRVLGESQRVEVVALPEPVW